MPRLANQRSTEIYLGSSGVGRVLDFGFQVGFLSIRNYGGAPLRFTLASTSPATTNDAELLGGEYFQYAVPLITHLGLFTTSTTTSTMARDTLVQVNAWSAF